MFSSYELISIIIGIFAIPTDVFVGFLGFISYKGKKIVNYLFLGLFLQSAWIALWPGLFHGGILKNNVKFYGGSQMISGFFGPFILLYTLALFNNEEKIPKKIYPVFIFGIFGTLFSILIFNSTNAEILQMMEFKKIPLSQIDFGEIPLPVALFFFTPWSYGSLLLVVSSMLSTNLLRQKIEWNNFSPFTFSYLL
jgi:hypothetical protein